MGKVIIGIHGRSNKPRPEALKAGWNQAILEVLSQNVGLPAVNFQFDLAYYSDVHYDNPLPESDYPYDAAGPGTLKRYRATLLDRIRSRAGDWLDDPFDWLEERSGLFSRVARSISRRFLRDLGDYYGDESDRRETQRRLLDVIERYQRDEIMIVAGGHQDERRAGGRTRRSQGAVAARRRQHGADRPAVSGAHRSAWRSKVNSRPCTLSGTIAASSHRYRTDCPVSVNPTHHP